MKASNSAFSGAIRLAVRRRIRTLKNKGANAEKPKPLSLISPPRIPLAACDGTKTIFSALVAHMSSLEKKAASPFLPKSIRDIEEDLGLLTDRTCSATEPASTRVYELVSDATFKEMRRQRKANPRNLALTEHQLLTFLQNNHEWLTDECGYVTTFFLVKRNDGSFIVVDLVFDASVSLDKFEIYTWEMCHRRVWNTKFSDGPGVRRLVVLAPEKKPART